MARKYIWTFCLTIGIIGITNSCMYDYNIDREFVYINETDHTIEFYIWAEIEDGVVVSVPLELPIAVKILPNSKSKVFSTGNGEYGRIKTNPNMGQWIIEALVGRRGASILVDGTECFLFENSGFALASNYKNEVLKDWLVRHIYTFTDADFEIGKPCEEEYVIEED